MSDESKIVGQAVTPTGSSAHAPHTGEGGNLSIRLRHAIENKFPHPIARSFYQLRRISDWLAEVPQIANVLGVTLEHLAIVALAEYLAGEKRDGRLNALLLETLRKPLSHGAWAGLLRDTMAYLHETRSQLFAPDLLSLYLPRRGGGERGTSLRDMGDELVQLRNELLKKSVESLPAYEQQQRFKRRLVEFLQTLGCLKDYPIIAVKQTRMHAGVKTHRCYLLTGFHDTFEQAELDCDLDLEVMRVAMLNPANCELLELYPFYVLRECPADGCRETHLFRFERIGHKGIEYIGAKGHRLTDEQAAAAFKALIQGDEWCSRLRHKSKYLCCDFAESWHQLPPGQHVDSRYEIIAHLRRGGMADVYQVKDTSDGAVRALKLLPFQFLSDQKMIQRFRYEAKQSRGFDHPNITRVYDYGEDLVDHYLVMELAQGWAAPGGHIALDVGELPKPLDVPAVLSIVKQACEGLDYIHRQQVIHRDVKPGNLLLFEDGWVKLADFGVARSRESITLTMTGLAMGTPEYMSPEQAEGKRDLTPASDIYSLGVVIYELLTGATPFKRATPLATAIAHLRDPVPAPTRLNPSIPEPLQKIVLKCLEKKPPHRFQTARELYHALAAYESTGRWEPLAGAGTTDDATDGALDTETEEGASVLERPPARPQVRDGAVGERPDNSERRNTAHTSDLTVPLWRNRRVAAAAALVALVCLSILGRFLWRLYSPPDSLVYEAKWQPNDDTLNLIVNDLRTKPLSIDQYQLRSNQFEHLLEVHICFDNDNGALYNTETNLFIKVFVSPGGEGGGQFSAHWLMTSRVTPEGDPRKIWHRKELRSETITFPIAPTSARDNIETLIEKIGPPPQEILDYLRERVGIAYSEIRPQVFLGVERRQWVLLPESGNFRVLLQCTRVHAMPYTREWLAKLGPVADIPTTPLDNRWKWNELEIVEEGDGPREGERRFTERVKPFERRYNLDDPANLDPNRDKMGMAKYTTAVKLLGLY